MLHLTRKFYLHRHRFIRLMARADIIGKHSTLGFFPVTKECRQSCIPALLAAIRSFAKLHDSRMRAFWQADVIHPPTQQERARHEATLQAALQAALHALQPLPEYRLMDLPHTRQHRAVWLSRHARCRSGYLAYSTLSSKGVIR